MREDLIRRRERILDEDQAAQLREAERDLSDKGESKKKPVTLTAVGANDAPKKFGATIGELCKGLKIQ